MGFATGFERQWIPPTDQLQPGEKGAIVQRCRDALNYGSIGGVDFKNPVERTIGRGWLVPPNVKHDGLSRAVSRETPKPTTVQTPKTRLGFLKIALPYE